MEGNSDGNTLNEEDTKRLNEFIDQLINSLLVGTTISIDNFKNSHKINRVDTIRKLTNVVTILGKIPSNKGTEITQKLNEKKEELKVKYGKMKTGPKGPVGPREKKEVQEQEQEEPVKKLRRETLERLRQLLYTTRPLTNESMNQYIQQQLQFNLEDDSNFGFDSNYDLTKAKIIEDTNKISELINRNLSRYTNFTENAVRNIREMHASTAVKESGRQLFQGVEPSPSFSRTPVRNLQVQSNVLSPSSPFLQERFGIQPSQNRKKLQIEPTLLKLQGDEFLKTYIASYTDEGSTNDYLPNLEASDSIILKFAHLIKPIINRVLQNERKYLDYLLEDSKLQRLSIFVKNDLFYRKIILSRDQLLAFKQDTAKIKDWETALSRNAQLSIVAPNKRPLYRQALLNRMNESVPMENMPFSVNLEAEFEKETSANEERNRVIYFMFWSNGNQVADEKINDSYKLYRIGFYF